MTEERIQDKQNKEYRTPVREVLAILLFLAFVGVLSWAVAFPFTRIFSNNNQFHVVFLGASETEWGINPEIINENTDNKSYLLATSGCTFDGRYEMLKAALDQESLELVVIDAAVFSLTKNMPDFDLDKRVLYFSRISGFPRQMSTAFDCFSFWEDEYDQLYAEMLYEGINTWKTVLNGSYGKVFARHGYDPQGGTSQLLSAQEAAKTYNSKTLNTKFRESNIARLTDILDLCREKQVPAIIITIPLSEHYLWQYDGWDAFHDFMTAFADEQDVPYYDFNLLTDRQEYLSDEVSYRDTEHLCDAGVTAFSGILKDLVLQVRAGEEPQLTFYDSYAEAKEHSVYQNIANGSD